MSGIDNFMNLSEDEKLAALRDKYGSSKLAASEKFYNLMKNEGQDLPPVSADNLNMFIGLVEKLGEQKVAAYQNSYKMFDKDTNGQIDADEYMSIMNSMGGEKTEAQAEADINFVTGGRADVVTFKDFCSIMENEQPYGDSQEKIIRAYSALDDNNDGKVNAAELKHIMLHYCKDLREADVDEMVKEAGIDANGNIDYQTWSQTLFAKPS